MIHALLLLLLPEVLSHLFLIGVGWGRHGLVRKDRTFLAVLGRAKQQPSK